MSDLLAAAKQAFPGVPDAIVMRSAQARATAQGASVDDVLAAWGGGASIPVAAEAPAPAAPVASAETAATPEAAAPVVETAAPVVAAAAPAPAAVALAEPPPPTEITPVPLGTRVAAGWRIGAALGAVAGLIAAVTGIARATDSFILLETGPGAAVLPARAMITFAVVFAFAGLVIAKVASSLPGRLRHDHAVEQRPVIIGATGLLLGGAFGAVTGAIVTGGHEEILGSEPAVGVPVVGSALLVILLGVIMGVVVGVIAQIITLPAGLEDDSHSLEVRKRLSTAYGVTVLIVAAAVTVIITLGRIFLMAPGLAPVVAIIVAGAILTFAFMSTSRPQMKVGRTEFLVVLGGVAIVLIFLSVIANAVGLTH